MKKTRVDRLGRIVIPIDCRKSLGITENTELIVDYDNSHVTITPVNESCKICGECAPISADLPLCLACVTKIKNDMI